MSILSEFEDRVGSAIEGMFAGVFKAPVQPAELARAAAKEMDKRKKLGVGKVYAPTLYSVLLSPADGNNLGGFADTLAGELATYLLGHARERNYALATRPVVRFLVDDELKLGRFEVIGELLSPEEIEAELGFQGAESYHDPDAVAAAASSPPAEQASQGGAVETAGLAPSTAYVFDLEAETDEAPPGAASEQTTLAAVIATVTVPGVAHDIVLRGERMVIGRLRGCEVCVGDANVSRKHAVLEREGSGWIVVDLGSTNGTLVNGARISRARLRDGDVITLGISELIYHEPRG